MRNVRSTTPLLAAVFLLIAMLLTGCGQAAPSAQSLAPGAADAPSPAVSSAVISGSLSASTAQLDDRQAFEAALAHAGLAAQDAELREIEADHDDGRLVYELEFRTAEGRYDYVVDAETGAVLEMDAEFSPATDPAAPTVTEQEAQAIALAHAGVAEADTRSLRTALGREDGREVYKVAFATDTARWDYEIALSGDILEVSFDAR